MYKHKYNNIKIICIYTYIYIYDFFDKKCYRRNLILRYDLICKCYNGTVQNIIGINRELLRKKGVFFTIQFITVTIFSFLIRVQMDQPVISTFLYKKLFNSQVSLWFAEKRIQSFLSAKVKRRVGSHSIEISNF